MNSRLSSTWRRMVGKALAGLTDPHAVDGDRRTIISGREDGEEEAEQARKRAHTVMDHLLFLGAVMDGDRVRILRLVEQGKIDVNRVSGVLLIACQRASVDSATLRARLRGSRLSFRAAISPGERENLGSIKVMSTLEGIELLVQLGLNVKESCKIADEITGMSALHFLAQAGDSECCKYLLDFGVDPKTTDLFGLTPLHFACWAAAKTTVDVLLEYGADPNAKSAHTHLTPGLRGVRPVHVLFSGGHCSVLKSISDHYMEGLGLIETSHTSMGHLEQRKKCIDTLWKAGANLAAVDCRLYNIFHYTMLCGASEQLIRHTAAFLFDSDQQDLVQFLLYSPDLYGESPVELSERESKTPVCDVIQTIAYMVPESFIEKAEDQVPLDVEEVVCPYCDQSVQQWAVTSGDHLVVCPSHPLPCVNKKHGCDVQICRENMFSHFLKCEYYVVVCFICHKDVPRSDIDQHTNELEQVGSPKCTVCEESHTVDKCSHFMIVCPSCGQEMLYANRNNHTCFKRTMQLLV